MRRWLYGAASVLAIAACAGDEDVGTEPNAAAAPLTGRASPKAIPGHYIVVLKDGVDNVAVATEHASARGAAVSHRYQHALNGYAAQLSPAALAAIQGDPRVRFVSEDREFFAVSICDPLNFRPPRQCLPAGIDRIDADRSTTRSGDGHGAVNVNVAVLDTGIDPNHPDLNVVGGIACVGNRFDDSHGHGTNVAGILGAKDNGIGVVGVAPGARLWAVRVLDETGTGTTGNVLCGIDWATSTRTDGNPSNDIAVANMSLGATGSDDGHCGNTDRDAVHLAICNSSAAGVTYVVAAGNASRDFAGAIPAAYREALTVTAMTDLDGKPGGATGGRSPCFPDEPFLDDKAATIFSNFATRPADKAHTVAAPGVCILSTDLSSAPFTGYFPFTGTSQATPHVAGTVALCVASGACAGLTPAQIIKKIVNRAAAYNTAHPGYGFIGDPIRPTAGKYYGFLIRAASY